MLIFIISAIFVCGIISILFLIKIKIFKNRIKGLNREVENQGGMLDYQKAQHSASLNHLHSVTIIVMELVKEILSD